MEGGKDWDRKGKGEGIMNKNKSWCEKRKPKLTTKNLGSGKAVKGGRNFCQRRRKEKKTSLQRN